MEKKFFLFKGLETQGVANKDCLSGDHLLLVNLYQHLLEECLTAGATDKNRHRAIVQLIQSRRSLVSFPLKLTCLLPQSLNLQRLWQVSTSLETIYSSHQDMKQGVHWRADFISHAYYFCSPGEFSSPILGL